jgi:SAM-dependent methyltransferase
MSFDRREGRVLFGLDPDGLASARPPYPERVYELLVERSGLREGTGTLEIGAGTGLATARLLALGARPLVALEPDAALAAHLLASLGDHAALEIREGSFEDADLPGGSFDLAVAATSFHWIEPAAALDRVRRLLRPGGSWAMWWHVFGDDDRPDPFHEATRHLGTGRRRSPSAGEGGRPAYALDRERRLADLAAAGLVDAWHETIPFTISLDADGVRRLYATFSETARLPEAQREALLDAYAAVAEEHFGGQVERPMQTVVYGARRPA